MKKIFKYFSFVTVAIMALASCQNLNQEPVFDDDDAFVAFDIATKSVSEDGGSISIPVTLASVAGLSSTVSYEFVDGTAALGKNYKPADESGILNFDSGNRTAYINVEILDNPGVFTGDLDFTIKFKSTGSVKEGAENACVVTITDNDHPLSAILGTYTAYPAGSNAGYTQYDVEITKDPDDLTMVWFYGLAHFAVANGANPGIYGYVKVDENGVPVSITVPSDQPIGLSTSSGDLVIYGMDAETFADAENDVPTIEFAVTEGGKRITMLNAFYIHNYTYYYDYTDAPMPMIKQ